LLDDTVNEVPPLKMLNGVDVAHLDALPLAAGSIPQKAGKILCDLQFVMNVIEQMVWLNNLQFVMNVLEQIFWLNNRWTDEHILESVNGMFQTVADHFIPEGDGSRHIRRNAHQKWQTFIPSFCRLHQ
jgi:hypothetical protein